MGKRYIYVYHVVYICQKEDSNGSGCATYSRGEPIKNERCVKYMENLIKNACGLKGVAITNWKLLYKLRR